jgi:NTP pyrophosphatase (non-canonical NTP hydrolase)
MSDDSHSSFSLSDFQALIDTMYSRKDEARGVEGTFMWLMEEVGELAAEFADVLAWLATIANVAGIDLQRAVLDKYGGGCPGCGAMVCTCADAEKP